MNKVDTLLLHLLEVRCNQSREGKWFRINPVEIRDTTGIRTSHQKKMLERMEELKLVKSRWKRSRSTGEFYKEVFLADEGIKKFGMTHLYPPEPSSNGIHTPPPSRARFLEEVKTKEKKSVLKNTQKSRSDPESKTTGFFPTKKVIEDTPYARSRAAWLHRIVTKNLKVRAKWNRSRWVREVYLLERDTGWNYDGIDSAMEWYEVHCKDKGVPKIKSASHFRKVFNWIHDLMVKDRLVHPKVVSPEAKQIYQSLKALGWPKGSDEQLQGVIQSSIENIHEYLDLLRKIVKTCHSKLKKLHYQYHREKINLGLARKEGRIPPPDSYAIWKEYKTNEEYFLIADYLLKRLGEHGAFLVETRFRDLHDVLPTLDRWKGDMSKFVITTDFWRFRDMIYGHLQKSGYSCEGYDQMMEAFR